MALTALAGVVVGALLGLLSALVIEARRDQRAARAAARIIQTELIEIVMVAHSLPDDNTYPYPMEDSAWQSHRDRLAAGGLSVDDWTSLASFYVMNALVESGALSGDTCAEVQRQAQNAVNVLTRFLGTSGWERLESRAARAFEPRKKA